jgi:hypothetical protein
MFHKREPHEGTQCATGMSKILFTRELIELIGSNHLVLVVATTSCLNDD